MKESQVKENISESVLEIVKVILKEDKYRILSYEQVKELSIEILNNLIKTK